MRNRTKIVVGASSVAVAIGAWAGIGAATSHVRVDTAKERAEERAYTDAHRAGAKITEEQAIAIAVARHAGEVIDVHLEDEGDGLRWEVKPDDGRQVWEVQIDATTGAIVGDQPDE